MQKILDAKFINKTHRDAENMSIMIWQGTILGMNALIIGHFIDNKLYRVNYKYLRQHTNENYWITDYYKIRDAFEKKYGKPKKDEVNWNNELYLGDKAKYGFAVSIGHVNLFSEWLKSRTRIQCVLQGENYECHLKSGYANIELEKIVKKRIEKIQQDRKF